MKALYVFCIFVIVSISIPCLACPPVNPTIDVQVSTNSPCAGQTVTFDADETVCADAGTLQYTWVFPPEAYCIYIYGDNGEYAQCKFSPSGSYGVNLKVKNLSTEMEGQWQTVADQSATCDPYTINVSDASIWYVSLDGDDDNNGQSWANAFRTIQIAIDSATDDDEILIDSGDGSTPAVYYEQLDMKGKSLYVHSVDPEGLLSEWELAENTIIDAQKQGTAVVFRGNETGPSSGNANFEGITITGGCPAGEGLALHLELDESTGTSASDSSGKERNGVLEFTSGPDWVSNGYIGGALEFDGDDYIEIQNYSGVAGSHSRTCAAWIKTSSSNSSMIMSWGEENTGEKWMFGLSADGNLQVAVWGGYIEGGDSGFNDSHWHHVAAVLEDNGNPTLDEIILYVDGIEQETSCYNCTGNPPRIDSAATESVKVGARFAEGVSTVYLDGVLDDVQIYSRALSQDEIEDLAIPPVPVAYLPLDNDANDFSGNGYHGTEYGDPNYVDNAIHLDGINDYVELPSDIINPASDSFSAFAWVRLDAKSSSNQLIMQQADGNGTGRALLYRTAADDTLRSYLGNASTISAQAVFSETCEWHYVGLTYDGQTVTLYTDGQSCGSCSQNAESCDGKLLIGINKFLNTDTCWDGPIDGLQIFKYALSADEVAQLAGQENFLDAHWKLDGDPNDCSDNGFDGTVYGDPNWTDGYDGQALQFDGNDDYVIVDDICGTLAAKDVTFGTWIKADQKDSPQFICAFNTSTYGNRILFGQQQSSPNLKTYDNGIWIDSGAPVFDKRWHHVAFVLSDTQDKCTLFVDGVSVYTYTTATSISADDLFSIGQEYDAGPVTGDFFDGILDDIRVYSRALTSSEIQALADKAPKLLAHWELDGNCDDATGNGYDGSEPNGLSWTVGMINDAVALDGTSDYISVPSHPRLKPQFPLTVSAWINLTASGTNSRILTTDYSTNQYAYSGVGFGLQYGGTDKIYISYGDGTGASPTGRGTKIGTTVLQPGQWYHVVGVIRDSQDMSIYINGVDDSGTYTGTSTRPIYYEGNDSSIGCARDNSGFPDSLFSGCIDDVRIYNYGLTTTEIQTLYQTRFADGGGIKGYGALTDISHSIIAGNESETNGGGISDVDGQISNCFIINNEAKDADGGGMADCDGDIINCVIAENTAENAGGLIGGDLNSGIVNCTIANNTANDAVGGIRDYNGMIANTILWGNTDTDPNTNTQDTQIKDCNTAAVTYSCIQDDTPGTTPIYADTGNIDDDPAFICAGTGDYHIYPGSSCRNAGDPNYVPGLGESDIDGQSRLMDTLVDIGADEVSNILYVHQSLPGQIQDGSSWERAFADLQDALDAASSGYEIWVAEGTYKPGTSRSDSFELVNGVEVYGGFDPTSGDDTWDERDYVNNQTILSGDIGAEGVNTDNCYHVVIGPDATDPNTVIDGFTITKGYANGSSQNSCGGGIYIGDDRYGLTIENCTISNNYAVQTGGGMHFNTNEYHSPNIINCTIINNEAAFFGGGIHYAGGAANIDGCVISNNTCSYFGVGSGGGMSHLGCREKSSITNCVFKDNTAGSQAGGLYAGITGTGQLQIMEISNCVFTGNSASGAGALEVDAPYNNSPDDFTVTNCVFSENSVAYEGGAIYCYSSSPEIVNCTFMRNSATSAYFGIGGAIYNRYSSYGAASPVVTNCIFWDDTAGNDADEIYNETNCDPTFSYCDIKGGLNGANCGGADSTDGGGNINSTPNFVDDTDPDGGGLALNSGSPCIDAADGNNDPTTDILGNSRYDDTNTTDTGTGSPTYVDMGAYEYQGN